MQFTRLISRYPQKNSDMMFKGVFQRSQRKSVDQAGKSDRQGGQSHGCICSLCGTLCPASIWSVRFSNVMEHLVRLLCDFECYSVHF